MEALQTRITKDPKDYDAYVELIPLLPSKEERHQLRLAFHQRFPLSENLWLEWLADAPKPISDDLLKLSIQDYLSPKLLVNYCQSMRENHNGNVELTRSHFQMAAGKCGSHFTQGHLVWNAWIAFEDSQTSDKVEYPLRRRALTCLEKVDEYWQEYCQRYPGTFKTHESNYKLVEQEHRKASEFEKQLRAIRGIDENPGSPLTSSNPALIGLWTKQMQKIKKQDHNKKKKHTMFFERAINDCCLTETFWINYLQEEEQDNQKDDQRLSEIAHRAIRNIGSFSGEAWAILIRAEEGRSGDAATIKRYFLDCQNVLRSTNVLLVENAMFSYLSYVARQNVQGLDEALRTCQELIEPFVDGKVLNATFRLFLRLMLFQAKCFGKMNMLVQFRQAWDKIHSLSPRNELLWTEHINHELGAVLNPPSDKDKIRKLYNDALHYSQGDLNCFNNLAESFMNYELLFGDRNEFLKAKLAIQNKRDILSNKKIKPENDSSNKSNKRKRPSVPETEESETKVIVVEAHKKVIKPYSEMGAKNDVVFVNALPDDVTRESVWSFFAESTNQIKGSFVKDVRILTRKAATTERPHRKYAYVAFGGDNQKSAEDAALEATKLSGTLLNNIILEIFLSNPPAKAKKNTDTRSEPSHEKVRNASSSSSASAPPEKMQPPPKPKKPLMPAILAKKKTTQE